MNIELIPSFNFSIEELIELNISSNLNHHLTGLNPPTNKEALQYHEANNKKQWNENTKRSFVIVYNETLIGRIIFEHNSPSTHLSYWLIPEYRNKGIMFKILKQALSIALKDKNIHYCMASCVKENENSQKLLKKIGFSKIKSENSNFYNYVLTKKYFFDF